MCPYFLYSGWILQLRPFSKFSIFPMKLCGICQYSPALGEFCGCVNSAFGRSEVLQQFLWHTALIAARISGGTGASTVSSWGRVFLSIIAHKFVFVFFLKDLRDIRKFSLHSPSLNTSWTALSHQSQLCTHLGGSINGGSLLSHKYGFKNIIMQKVATRVHNGSKASIVLQKSKRKVGAVT